MTGMYRELVRFAEGLPEDKPYHQETQYLWALGLDAEGRPCGADLIPLTTIQMDRKGNPKVVPGVRHVTPTLKRTSGVDPLVPHDGLAYVLGWCDEKSQPGRVTEAHQAYVGLIQEWANNEGANDPVAKALLQFVSGDAINTIRRPEQWSSKDNLLIQVGPTLAHEARSLSRFWTRHVESSKASGARSACLICGHVGTLVDTLPQMIKGPLVPGGQSSGVAPISVNAAAFGFNLSTGLSHVPVCNECARAIPAAFNDLLGDGARRHRSESAATTWWIRGESQFDPLDAIEQANESDVVALIRSVESAHKIQATIDGDQFNCLVVSGNGPRLIIRDWTSIPLHELRAHVAAWFTDTEMVPEWPNQSRFTPLWTLATATGRFDQKTSRYKWLGEKAGHHPHQIVEDLRRAALRGGPPPLPLASWVIVRICADHHVDTARAALLRLALRRTYSKGSLMPGLDPLCTDPCYVAGRLFAQYAQIQYAASTLDDGKTPNATFADKHFAGAVATPATAIAAGEKQASAWLSKLRRKGRDAPYVRELDALMELLDPMNPLPTRASIEQQAMFVLGYHHQRAQAHHARDAARQAKLATQTHSPDQD